jgi:predicted TIM-barrel fold metal-dependent hydrolase
MSSFGEFMAWDVNKGENTASGGLPYLVVSTDSHAGPSLEHHLRPYCPAHCLPEFDDFVASFKARSSLETRYPLVSLLARATEEHHVHAAVAQSPLSAAASAEGIATLARVESNPGSYDAAVRLAHMDADGIAAEVIFAGAQNHEVLPWAGGFDAGDASVDPHLRAVGCRIWNEWLAEFCSAAPHRLLGVMQVPIWDVALAAKEVAWGKRHGLRAVNLPAPRPDYPSYNVDTYDPFWTAVEEADLPLVTHSASGERWSGALGVGALMLFQAEMLWLSRRALGQIIFGQVFDRHPTLRLGFIEQRANWMADHLSELDSVYYGIPANHVVALTEFGIEAPEKAPSEYWGSNCFVGGSFLAHFEVEARHAIGVHTLMWGSDYPHLEGTWPRTRLAMRHCFAGVPEPDVRSILGMNGVGVFRLDMEALRPVADRIGPTPRSCAPH